MTTTPTQADRPVDPADIEAVARALQGTFTGYLGYGDASELAVAAIDTLIARGNHSALAASKARDVVELTDEQIIAIGEDFVINATDEELVRFARSLLATRASEAAPPAMIRQEVEQFLVDYHAAIWEAAQGGEIAYDAAGEKLAEAFLVKFGEGAPRGTDAQILFERKLTCEAINGAMALGYRDEMPAPEGHWLAPYWAIGRKQCELEDDVLLAPGQSEAAPVAVGDANPIDERSIVLILIEVARTAFRALDDSEEREGSDGREHAIDSRSFDELGEALDRLDFLPDDKPGYTMDGPGRAEWALRKLLSTLALQAVPVTQDAQNELEIERIQDYAEQNMLTLEEANDVLRADGLPTDRVPPIADAAKGESK